MPTKAKPAAPKAATPKIKPTTKAKPKAVVVEPVAESKPVGYGSIRSVFQDGATLSIHIVFSDGSKIEKLRVPVGVYKQFEECFQSEGWPVLAMAFVEKELGAYETSYSV